MNAKQEAFAHEYLVDLNATQAAIRAGYSPRSAVNQGDRMMRNDEVARLIAKLAEERNQRLEVDADAVLARLERLWQLDLRDFFTETGRLKPVPELSKDQLDLLESLDINALFDGEGKNKKWIGESQKIRWISKLTVLKEIGRHVDVGAFRDRVQHEGLTHEEALRELRGESNGGRK